jgi:hypothetical protein
VMVKLITQKNKNRYSNNKKFSLLGKSSGFISLVSNPSIGAWYSRLCGDRCCPSCWTAWGGDNWRVFLFFFSTFFGLMGCPLQAGALKWSHQACEQYLVPSVHGQVAIGT